MPCVSSISSTSRRERLKRTYSQNRVREDLWWKMVALVAADHTYAQQLSKNSYASNKPGLM